VGKHAGSLLTRKIAADNLADAYMAFNTNYHDTGLFGVYAVTDRDRSQVSGRGVGGVGGGGVQV
jgi:processing peptidase subunit beta